jgi:hypothetical protein
MGTRGADHATEHWRVTIAMSATGEPPRDDIVKDLIPREHALIRRHLNHMRCVADEAQHEVKLCTPGYGPPAGRGA